MPLAAAYPKKAKRKPTVPMRQLHWAVVPDKKLEGSMWEKHVDDRKVELDTEQLESLFASKPAAAPIEVKKESTKVEKVMLLDPKRATSIATALQSFKSTLKLSKEMLCTAVRDGNIDMFVSEKMEMYTVMTMLTTVMPSAEEAEMVQSHDGPQEELRDLEQFVLQVAKEVPKAMLHAKCLTIRSTFASSCREHMEVVSAVKDAATEVKASETLKEVIQYTLALGNYLNGETKKGGAWGFKLEALGKLANTKTLDNKRTLLHYMAEKLPGRGKKLREEMPALSDLRFEWKSETAEISILKGQLKVVSNAAEHDPVEAFVSNTTAFLGEAEQLMNALDAEQKAAETACKDLGNYLVEDSLTSEPETFFNLLQSFVLSFEKAEKFNHEMQQKKKREEAQAKRDEERRNRSLLGATAGAGKPTPTQDKAFKDDLNKALLLKAGIKNERRNLIDAVESQGRPTRHKSSQRH